MCDTESKLQYFTGWVGIIAIATVICFFFSTIKGCNKDDNEYKLKAAEIKASQPASPVQEKAEAANVKITVEQK